MLRRFYEWIGRAELQVAKYALGLMTALIFVSAIMRTIGYPLAFAVDGATFLFAWCVFTAADVAMRKDKLVCVDILIMRFPKKVRYYIRLFNYGVIVIFLGFLLYYGAKLSYDTRYRAFQGIYWLSYTWVTIAVPFGSAMMMITGILKIRDQLRDGIEHFNVVYASDQGEFL